MTSHNYDINTDNIIYFSYLLDSQVKLILVQQQEIQQISVGKFNNMSSSSYSPETIDLVNKDYNH